MSNLDAKMKADGAESLSTAGLGAWLPIETAPANTDILCYSEDYEPRFFVGRHRAASTDFKEMSMSEIEQLKQRIDASGREGVETAHIRDDYEPVGAMMIRDICATGDYVQRKVPPGGFDQKWKVFKKGVEPY